MIRLRIELQNIAPLIWREIVVPASTTLDVLHEVIQGAMAWQDSHLQEFEIKGKRYQAPEFPEEDWEYDEDFLSQREFKLSDLVGQGDEFIYTYDFGDNWRHKITVVEKRKIDGSPDTVFPCCLDGERACPPEDCGGPYRYEDFIEELTNPKHPAHEATLEWAGAFDPEIFSVAQANAFVGAMYMWGIEKRMKYSKSH